MLLTDHLKNLKYHTALYQAGHTVLCRGEKTCRDPLPCIPCCYQGGPPPDNSNVGLINGGTHMESPESRGDYGPALCWLPIGLKGSGFLGHLPVG